MTNPVNSETAGPASGKRFSLSAPRADSPTSFIRPRGTPNNSNEADTAKLRKFGLVKAFVVPAKPVLSSVSKTFRATMLAPTNT